MKTVLIVEDDSSIASLLEETLHDDGYEVIDIARTVADAIALIQEHKPDFAVIDLNLAQDGNGNDIAIFIRQASVDTAILISTGNDHMLCGNQCCSSKICCRLQGDAVMVKPYNMYDVSKAFNIIKDMREHGSSLIPHPHNFKLLSKILTKA